MNTYLRAAALAAVLLTAGCGEGNGTATESGIPESLALTERSEGPPAISVVQPREGAVVTSPFDLTVETENIELNAAGEARDRAGHFHVITNGECVPAGEIIPQDDDHFHGRSGGPTLSIWLEPGTYDLCVQLGDGFHVALGVFDTVSIVVEESPLGEAAPEADHGDDHSDHG